MNGCIKIKEFNVGFENSDKGFKHNWQGTRVVRDLESKSRAYRGLNLTNYTAWGILNHSSLNYKGCGRNYYVKKKGLFVELDKKMCGINHAENEVCDHGISLGFYEKLNDSFVSDKAWSFEGLIVGLADEVAQRHHDIEDGIEANIVDREYLVQIIEWTFKNFMQEFNKDFENLKNEKEKEYYMPMFSRFIVNFLTSKLLENLKCTLNRFIEDLGIKTAEDFHKINAENPNAILMKAKECISYDKEFETAEGIFHNFLKTMILNSYHAQRMDGRSQYIIKQLFKAYVSNPQQLPNATVTKVCMKILPEMNRSIFSNGGSLEISNGNNRRVLEELHYNARHKEYKIALVRTITDYISGMTDEFATSQYQALYGNKVKY